MPAGVPAFYQPLFGFPSQVVPGQTITFALPDLTTSFRLVVYSDPTVLATGSSGGIYQATMPTTLTPGTHHLILWAVVDGVLEVRGTTIEVMAQVDPVGELPATGSSPHLVLWLALLLTLLGLVAVGSATRRRLDAEEGGR